MRIRTYMYIIYELHYLFHFSNLSWTFVYYKFRIKNNINFACKITGIVKKWQRCEPLTFVLKTIEYLIHDVPFHSAALIDGKMTRQLNLLVLVSLICLIIQGLDCTLSKNDPKKPKSKPSVTIKVSCTVSFPYSCQNKSCDS